MNKIILPFTYFYKSILLYFLYFFFKSKKKSCNICSSKSFSIFFTSRNYLKKLRIVKCNECNIKYQNPQLSNNGLNIYYKYVYRFDYIFRSRDNLFKREQKRGNYIIKYLIQNNISLNGKKIFEIGTGCGGIINQFKIQYNAQVEGIDLDEKTIRFGINKKINLETNSIENYKTTTKCDIIILSHVIEHIYDLKNFFKLLKNFTHKSTFIYIEVPGLENERVKKRKYSLQPGHLYYFDQNNLSIFFKNNGLRIISQNNIIQMVLEYEE